MLPLLLLPLSVGSEPPAFAVTNKVPPFVVVNKVGPKPAAPTYADILARVQRGGTVEFVAPLPGFPGEPGAYRAWMENGTPVMQRKGVAVTTAQPFRGSDYHPSHDCPVCGRAQYVISGFNPDGTHNHTCSAGHTWRH